MMKKTPYIIVCLTALLLLFGACGEDRWEAYYDYTADNLWIDGLMREHYLWEEDMPDAKELTSDYFGTNSAFLSAVMHEEDAFTKIDSLTTLKADYGMTYNMQKLSDEDVYAAMVTYVEPGSPAGIAGIERGTWIMEVDGVGITSANSSTVLSDGADHLLTMGRYVVVTDETGEETSYISAYAYAPLGEATVYERSDVPYHALLTADSHTVGYLLCNRFAAESTALLDISNEFASAGVTDVVLDLRYNSSSTLEGMQLLGSILAPASALGQTLASVKYNSKAKPEWPSTLTLSTPQGGANLNLSTLYVLTSSSTKGLSEHLINSLKAYMNVVVVGNTTSGEYYATKVFDNTDIGLQLRLVTGVMFDATGTEADFSGFTPDVRVSDTSDPTSVLPFGDAGETLLAAALQQMQS